MAEHWSPTPKVRGSTPLSPVIFEIEFFSYFWNVKGKRVNNFLRSTHLDMAFILNTPVSEKKNCVVALNEIYGLGKILIHQICDQLGISSQVKCKHLSANQIDLLTACISQNYLTGADLRGVVRKSMERSVYINSFKGFRYIEKLPCRGQRTHGNARTVRRVSSLIFNSSIVSSAQKNLGKRRLHGSKKGTYKK